MTNTKNSLKNSSNLNPVFMDPQHVITFLQKPYLLFTSFSKSKKLTCSLVIFLPVFLLLLNTIGIFPTNISPSAILSIGTWPGNWSVIPKKRCDLAYGKWVRDETYAKGFYNEDCPFLDPGFRCGQLGRKDDEYRKWRWQPNGCNLLKSNATELLERSRNGRIAFVGDSIGRNQWESFLCMLAQSVKNVSSIYEEKGLKISDNHKTFLKMRFQDYNLTVEYYRDTFLVAQARRPENSPKEVKGVIKVDTIHGYSKWWMGADVLVFNSGHWWNNDKIRKMGYYFQEGDTVNMTMDVKEAFRRSLKTWKTWIDENVDPLNTHVFFRTYSPVHYRGGTWDLGGYCNTSTVPETNYTKLEQDPWYNQVIQETIHPLVKDVNISLIGILNITYLSEFRIDGHPSIYREPWLPNVALQDCSHWCLPGVPDTWNELLYADLISRGYRTTTIYEIAK